jgi:hypothetical protein
MAIISGIFTFIAWVYTFLTICAIVVAKEDNSLVNRVFPWACVFWILAITFTPD